MNPKPKENGNVTQIEEICSSVHPLILLRHEALASFLSEEPIFIMMKNTDAEEHRLEQVLRIRCWSSNRSITSWQLYSENRKLINESEEFSSLVIRKVEWKCSTDILSKLDHASRIRLLQEWPDVQIQNVYLNSISKNEITMFGKLLELDNMISNGVILQEVENSNHRIWPEIEVMRFYDWGSVKAIWDNTRENKDLEAILQECSAFLDNVLLNKREEDFEMKLDYSIPTETYRSIVTSSK